MAEDVTSGTGRLRCAWEVRAGVIPGKPEEERTRRWFLTSETFHAENDMPEEEFKQKFPDGKSTFMKFRDAAFDYALSLHDPQYLNWVDVSWIWY